METAKAEAVVHDGAGTGVTLTTTGAGGDAALAQARAQIEAMFLVARARPRSWDDVRAKLLEECRRPGFAATAWYRKPQGGSFAEGLSARFAEAAFRLAGNMRRGARATYDDASKRQLTIYVVDLETNFWSEQEVVLDKTIERTSDHGRQIVSKRPGASGREVFVVVATEDELRQKEASLISKVARNLVLDIMPADVLDDCIQEIRTTRSNKDAKDPLAARTAMLDAFTMLNVMPSQLIQFVGHDVAQCSPAELEDLRDLYAAIRSGDTTWSEVVAAGRVEPPPSDLQPTQASAAPTPPPPVDSGVPFDQPRQPRKPRAPKPPAPEPTRTRTEPVQSELAGKSVTDDTLFGANSPSAQAHAAGASPEAPSPVAATASLAPASDPVAETMQQLTSSFKPPTAAPASSVLGQTVLQVQSPTSPQTTQWPSGSVTAPVAAPPPAAAVVPTPPPTTSIADERTKRLAEQQALIVWWNNYPIGTPVKANIVGGPIDTRTSQRARMFGDQAIINVEGIDSPIALAKLVLREAAPPTVGAAS